jgi:ComF family protein
MPFAMRVWRHLANPSQGAKSALPNQPSKFAAAAFKTHRPSMRVGRPCLTQGHGCRSSLSSSFKANPDGQGILPLLMHSTPFVADALEQAQVLIPIPLSFKRLSERGFNQSLVLSQQLSPQKTHPSSLLRMRNTLAQSTLPRNERLTNLKGAFAVAPLMAAKLRGQRILLIDDVMTSGATLNAAAQVLKQAGAAHVSALVFARTPA